MRTTPFGYLSRWCRKQLAQQLSTGRPLRPRKTRSPVAAMVELLEDRSLLSSVTGVYDENAVQTNAVDRTAQDSSMTHSQFAADVATAWANNSGGVIDGSAFDSIYGFGQDQTKLLHVLPDEYAGWEHRPLLSSPLPISGEDAFSTAYSAAYGGRSQSTLYFGVEFGETDENVLQFGLTVLGQNADYGIAFVFGHLARGGTMTVTHEVLGEETEDVFYGLAAPSGDYFYGFTIAYDPGGAVDHPPLFFDDIGFVTGNPNGGTNEAPTATGDAYSLEPDTLLQIDAPGVLANDADPDGNLLTPYLVQGPSNGILQLNDDGSFYYMPDNGFVGTDEFTYAVWDGTISSEFATVTLTVGDPGEPPVANDDAYTLTEDQTLLVSDLDGLLANDTDPESAPLTASLVAGPSHGTLNLNSDGSFVYTPEADFFGTDTFSYVASDGVWLSNVATVTMTVAGTNDVPLAQDDAYTLNEDVSLVVDGVAGVLANDADPESDPLSAVLVSGPSHGTLGLNADGSFTYTPEPNYFGSDSFSYRAHDGALDSTVAMVLLTVTARQDAPIARNDSFSINENETLAVPVGPTGLLTNDSDPDGDSLVSVLVSGPRHGTLSLNPDGSFQYTPATGYYGSDSFSYRASDGTAVSNVATVTLTIASVNELPIAQEDAWSVTEDGTLVVSLDATASLSMISEPGDYIGQGRTYDLDQSTGSFTATRNFDQGVTVRYQSASNSSDYWVLNFAAPGEAVLTAGQYTGATRYQFQAPAAPGLSVYGQGRGSNTLTGEFTVHQVVYGPSGEVLVFDASFEQHNEGFDPALTGRVRYASNSLLANDVDPDGDPLSAVLVAGPGNGTLSLNSNGTFEYTPHGDFHGTDTFTYRANDGTTESDSTTVTIHVSPVNDAPVAVGQSVWTDEDTNLSGTVTAGDVDGDSLQFALAQGPAYGVVVFNPDGTWTYTPDADFHGSDSFSFTAGDGSTVSAPATVTITVAPVNDAPVAVGQSVSTEEDTSLSGTVTAGDVDGDSLQFALAEGPSYGVVVFNADGTWTYTPDADFHGSDSFLFTADDGSTVSAPATVTITVTPVNDAPVAVGQSVWTDEDTNLSGTVTAGDVDGDSLQFMLAEGPAYGTVIFNADGTWTYTPDADFHGSDSFSFTADDGSTVSAPAAVTITVASVNDAPVAVGQSVSTDEDTSLSGTVTAGDMDGDLLQFALAQGPTYGDLVFNVDGTWTYTPDADFHGSDSFSFTAGDGSTVSTPAAVTITVAPVNDAPLLNGAELSLEENSANGTIAGSVVGSDLDGDSLTYSITSGNQAGPFVIDPATGQITVANSSLLDFETTSAFVLTVRVTDAGGLYAKATVTVQLTDVVETLTVAIDILPGDSSNTIKSSGNGRVEVAILSTSEFDATTIDVEGLRFGRTGSEDSLSRTSTGAPRYRLADVNGDGLLDLVVTFERSRMGFVSGDTVGVLTGQTLSGMPLEGRDDVNLSGNWP